MDSSSLGDRCTHMAEHSSKRLVLLGNTLKKKECKTSCFAIGPAGVEFW